MHETEAQAILMGLMLAGAVQGAIAKKSKLLGGSFALESVLGGLFDGIVYGSLLYLGFRLHFGRRVAAPA